MKPAPGDSPAAQALREAMVRDQFAARGIKDPRILDAFRRSRRSRVLIGLPLLLVVWVDLHYGFVFGLAALGLVASTESVKTLFDLPPAPLSRTRLAHLWLSLAAAAAATLVNPQHIHALVFPFEILARGNPWANVIEWKPPHLMSNGVPTPLVWILAAQTLALVAAAARRPERVDLSDTALVGLTAAMALRSRRFAPLFALVGAPLLAAHVATALRGLDPTELRRRELRSRWGALAGGAIGLAVAVVSLTTLAADLRQARHEGFFNWLVHAERMPRDAVAFLRRNHIEGRLFNAFPWGGYVLYALPGVRVYQDGRAHAVYSRALWAEARAIERAEPNGLRRLDRRGVEIVLDESAAALPLRLRRRRGWQRIYDDTQATVWVRRSPRTEHWTRALEADRLWFPDAPGAQLFRATDAGRRRNDGAKLRAIHRLVERFGDAARIAILRRQRIEAGAAALTGAAQAIRTAALLERALRGGAPPARRPRAGPPAAPG